MAEIFGWVGKVLRVDLGTGEISVEDTHSYLPFVGGRGLGLKVIAEEAPAAGAFDAENRLIVAAGPLSGTSADEGKGGRQHRYLQGLIKRFAEENGYRAIIEKPILDGQGQVDISLERDDKKIACEVSVTTSGQQEFGNVEKCLTAGYDEVILCSADRGSLRRIETYITAALGESARARVRFLEPEALLLYLGQQTEEQASPPDEQRVRGYKVKVQHHVVPTRGKRHGSSPQVAEGSVPPRSLSPLGASRPSDCSG